MLTSIYQCTFSGKITKVTNEEIGKDYATIIKQKYKKKNFTNIIKNRSTYGYNHNSLHVLVVKKERKLYLFQRNKIIKVYDIVLGTVPYGRKLKRGDHKTPEGNYFIIHKNNKNLKSYLKPSVLGISYPNQEDAKWGYKNNLINLKQYQQITHAVKLKKMPLQNTKLGGQILIHGSTTLLLDWTQGCIAMLYKDMNDLYQRVKIKTPVNIINY